jgi:hypothetical protein
MSRVSRSVLVVVLLGLGACQKRSEEGSLGTVRLGKKVDARFTKAWQELAARSDEESEVIYIEDDSAEGLMGRVRRGATAVPRPSPPPSTSPPAATGEPEVPSGEAVSAAVRSNVAGVKACYLRLTRQGKSIAGRAIVSFTVDKDGSARDVRVDAPAFEESDLPKCVSQQVERWTFPRSKRGGFAVSYPFVFVGD